MPYLDEATCRERERSWRDKAAVLPPGPEREIFTGLADGYAHFVELLGKIEAAKKGRPEGRPDADNRYANRPPVWASWPPSVASLVAEVEERSEAGEEAVRQGRGRGASRHLQDTRRPGRRD